MTAWTWNKKSKNINDNSNSEFIEQKLQKHFQIYLKSHISKWLFNFQSVSKTALKSFRRTSITSMLACIDCFFPFLDCLCLFQSFFQPHLRSKTFSKLLIFQDDSLKNFKTSFQMNDFKYQLFPSKAHANQSHLSRASRLFLA